MQLFGAESNSDEEPQPQQRRQGRTKKQLLRDYKPPQFKIGDAIAGPYWDPEEDPKREHGAKGWYNGKIANVKVVNASGPFGPICKYDIKFDDGDFESDVPEDMVNTQSDYELSDEFNDGKFKLISRVTEKNTKDEWAKDVGYYVLTLDNEKINFTFLTDAVEKHDKSVVERKGEDTKKADLYQPKKLKALLKEYRATQSKKIRYVDCFIMPSTNRPKLNFA